MQIELARCLDASHRTKQNLVFSGLSAWKIHGMYMPRVQAIIDEQMHVCVRDQRQRSQLRGVRFHVWSQSRQIRTLFIGEEVVRIVDAFTACMQMLKHLTREEAVVMFEVLICRDEFTRVMTLQELTEDFNLLGRFHGKEIGAWALSHCRASVDSPMETRLRLRMVASGLPCPEVNYRVDHPDTDETWFLDLAYPDLHIAFEYQGEQYHANREGLRRDSRKLSALQGLGWRVIVVTADMLQSEWAWGMLMDTIIDVIRQQSRLYGVRMRIRRR